MNSTPKKKIAMKAPSEDAWNSYKERLRRLYFNLTLSELMEAMKKDFGFIASKNQYERKFKEWGFRKNHSKKDWEHVIRKKRKRDEANKETRIVLHGVEIPAKRLKKEESRYSLSDLNKISSLYPTAPTPEGLSVATPPATLLDLYTRSIRIDNLPYFGLKDLLATSTNSRQYPGFPVNASSQRNFSETSTSLLSVPSIPVISVAELLGYHVDFSVVSTANMREEVFRQFRNATIERYEGEIEDRIASFFGSSSSSEIEEILTFIAQFGSNNLLDWHQKSIILDWISEQTQKFLEHLIQIESPSIQACLEALIKGSPELHNSPAFTALIRADKNRRLYHGRREILLLKAIELSLIDVVKVLVHEGINVNCKVKRRSPYYGGVSSTLLGAARDVGVAKILIDAGADVNAPVHEMKELDEEDDNEIKHYSPVYYAAAHGEHDLMRVFLNAGAQFDWTDVGVFEHLDEESKTFLAGAMDLESTEMVKLLLGLGTECSDDLCFFLDADQKQHIQRSELQQACFLGDTEIVEALLATDSAIRFLQTSNYRWAPLRDAAMRGHLVIVELLIEAGADVNLASGEENNDRVLRIPTTPLMAAVEAGHLEVVKSLLRHGVDVNAPAVSKWGTSVLAVAETLENHDIASVLREAGATSHRDGRQLIADVQFAAARKDLPKAQGLIALGVDACHILDTSKAILDWASGTPRDVLETFLAVCGSKFDSRGPVSKSSALEIAIDLQDVTIIEMLGCGGADFNAIASDGCPFLQHALYLYRSNCSTYEVVDRLLQHGATVDIPKKHSDKLRTWVRMPLKIAAFHHDQSTIERLLLSDTCHNKAASASMILSLAISNRNLAISSIQFLLDQGADVNATTGPKTALNAAISLEWIECVKLLLDRGADVNATTGSETPLNEAIFRGWMDCIKLLLDRSANINSPALKDGGSTPLQTAASCHSVETCRLLLERGADVNAPPADWRGRTALQAAINQDSPSSEIIQMLIDHHADINALPAMEYGVTALQAAACSGHLKIALHLLQLGADSNAPGSPGEGRTALEGAAENGRLDMVQLLLNAGAEPTQSAVDFAKGKNHFVIADLIKSALNEKEACKQGNGKGKEVER